MPLYYYKTMKTQEKKMEGNTEKVVREREKVIIVGKWENK